MARKMHLCIKHIKYVQKYCNNKKKLTIAKNKFGIKILGKIMLDKKMQPQITK